jgi:RNA polymerase sigma-70 factor, ECF subfamily
MSVQTLDKRATSLNDLADGKLVKETLAGEHKAFECLVLRYEKPLFNFICHFLGNYDWACDVLQDVFLKFYISLPTLHTDQSLKPWLFQVARNRCLDELRRKHPMSFSQLEVPDEEEEISPVMILPDPDPLPQEIAEHHELQHMWLVGLDLWSKLVRDCLLLSSALVLKRGPDRLLCRSLVVGRKDQTMRKLLRVIATAFLLWQVSDLVKKARAEIKTQSPSQE